MDVEDYATSFRPDIIDAVSGWCQGGTFAKVLTLTDVFEASHLADACSLLLLSWLFASSVMMMLIDTAAEPITYDRRASLLDEHA